MLRFAISPAFYFNMCICDDWLSVREGERAETCALPGVPNMQTDGQKFRDQYGDPFAFWCERLKANAATPLLVGGVTGCLCPL